ncbi:hypothetical protein AGABI2DRAFT_194386 [Agaricus bisporus var. bisporus H97]|uniref:hypothetical protein n=1 Tax=Agaricus bisporus var. bisporus (strain H97 / ATCC MYA-4626 / FGSC 10389) TaxID=936046 RepID=UPI00029F6F97|nr:hypothetical protein AGABI2DRAFT_194386 [Agaricus bisporus var. bisporus H97]EKV45466.1 hypothetical protein AGABI2DRAFT_194386 [Agaricus bisporus var. bisporus H97]
MASSEGITQIVNAAYSERAAKGVDANVSIAVASAVGYSTTELASVPSGSSLGLSCGTPVKDANLREGESVLDLGSGGGLDVFLAADLVGTTGKVVGLDGSKAMVDLSRQNAKAKGVKPPHVAFAQASFTEELPIEPCSVDCVISNCVLNLLPDDGKALTLRETYRVLRPGGRAHFSDIVAIRDIPAELKEDPVMHVNCISGAISWQKYEDLLRKAGFIDISFSNVTNGLSACCTAPLQLTKSDRHPATETISSFDVDKFVASNRILARKPESPQEKISSTILKQWWDAYPLVNSSPEAMTAEEVASLIRDPSKNVQDFVVVDVRRNDHAGGHVKGSVQCPAQSFYDDAPAYFEKFKDTEKVIFYCQSSNGRGPRCAGWYQDYLDSMGCSSSKAYVLAGGIKGWMGKYKGQHDLMDYD